MSTAVIRSIEVGVESSFGSIETATGIPTTDGITWRSLECERGSLETFGDPAMNERTEARDGPHGVPPEPNAVWKDGVRIQRRTGTITLTMPVRPLGTGNAGATISTYGTLPMFQIINSGMWDAGASASTSDTCGAASSVNEIVAGSTSNYNLGELVSIAENNRFEVACVTDILAATVDVSPAFSAAPANQEVRTMRTMYVDNSLSTSTIGSSVALRLNGIGWRTLAFGCRMQSVKFSLRNKQLMAEVVLSAAHVRDDHSNADTVEPARTDASPVHFLNSYAIISGATATAAAAGVQLTRRAMSLDDIEVTLTNTLTPAGLSDTAIGMANMEVTEVAVEAVLTLSSPSTLMVNDFRNQDTRHVLLGFAGEFASAAATEVGNGFAIFLPSAYLNVDPQKRDLSTGIVRQVLNYMPGRYAGDDGSTGACNSMFRIGFGN